MLRIESKAQVFIVPDATDMRNVNELCNRGRTIIKVLYWDDNGFCLWQKSLDKHRFFWPNPVQEVLEFSDQPLRWILDALDPMRAKGHACVS